MQENIFCCIKKWEHHLTRNCFSLEFDAITITHLKQDLIGGRAVTNGMDFQVIVDKESRTLMSAEFILASMANCAASKIQFLLLVMTRVCIV